MEIANASDYPLILVALIAHYELGRRIGVSHFFTRCLTGASFSALIAATLANFASGLIRPYLLAAVIVGGVLTARSLYQESLKLTRSEWRQVLVPYGALIGLSLAFWVFNQPEALHLIHRPDGTTHLDFNRHLSYYANPAMEMLQADYLSRLRISNVWPIEWARYHFFNPASLAVSQVLVRSLGLFSYLHALYVLVFLILLSFGEQLIFRFRNGLAGLIPYALLVFLWTTLFYPAVTWNIASTGTFSVFGIVHLVFALLGGNIRHAAIFSVVTGASVIRLYPLSALSLGALWMLYSFKKAPKLSRIEWAGLALYLVYFGVTIVSGASTGDSAMSRDPLFDAKWFSFLSIHQLLGFYSANFFVENHYPNFNYGYADRFRSLTSGDLVRYFWILQLPILLYGFVSAYRGARERLRSLSPIYSRVTVLAAVLIPYLWASQVVHAFYARESRDAFSFKLFTLLPRMTSSDGFRLEGVTVTAILAVILIMCAIWACSREKRGFARPVSYLLILQLGAFGCQFFGNAFMKVPILMVAFDLVIWALIAGWVAQLRKGAAMLAVSACWVAVCMAIFKPSYRGILKVEPNDNNNSIADISSLVAPGATRSDFVDSEGFFRLTPEVNPIRWDIYSVLLGARVRHIPRKHLDRNQEWFLTERFIPEGSRGSQ